MNETQFNATRQAEAAARVLAERFSLPKPRFYEPHGDPVITATRALVAIGAFLESLANAPQPPAHVASLQESIDAATLDELMEIPGIGKVTAKRIKGE